MLRPGVASYTSTIPVSGSVTVGFTGAKGATKTAPTAFTLSGANCAAATATPASA